MIEITATMIEILRIDKNADTLFFVFDDRHKKRLKIRNRKNMIAITVILIFFISIVVVIYKNEMND